MSDDTAAKNDNDGDIELIADEDAALPDLQKKIKKLKEELKKCEMERKEYLDGWQRAKADSINYRKDESRRLEDIGRFVGASMIEEILPVLDSFDLALNHDMPSETVKGILLIRSQFEDVLKKRGLEEIETKAGDEFNTEKHESIGEVESALPHGVIAEAVQRGYLLRGRVLRPVRVRLSKGRE